MKIFYGVKDLSIGLLKVGKVVGKAGIGATKVTAKVTMTACRIAYHGPSIPDSYVNKVKDAFHTEPKVVVNDGTPKVKGFWARVKEEKSEPVEVLIDVNVDQNTPQS